MALNNFWDFLNGLDQHGTYIIKVVVPLSGLSEQLVNRFGMSPEQVLRFHVRDPRQIVQVVDELRNNNMYELQSVHWSGRGGQFTVNVSEEFREVNAWIPNVNFQNELTMLLENSGYRLRMRRN